MYTMIRKTTVEDFDYGKLEVSGNGFQISIPSHSRTSIPISHSILRFLPKLFPRTASSHSLSIPIPETKPNTG